MYTYVCICIYTCTYVYNLCIHIGFRGGIYLGSMRTTPQWLRSRFGTYILNMHTCMDRVFARTGTYAHTHTCAHTGTYAHADTYAHIDTHAHADTFLYTTLGIFFIFLYVYDCVSVLSLTHSLTHSLSHAPTLTLYVCVCVFVCVSVCVHICVQECCRVWKSSTL